MRMISSLSVSPSSPDSLSFCPFLFHKVQWSHLAALKSNASAPPVSRSHSFSDPVPSLAHLHLRSQEPHHPAHPAHPARSEHPHPLIHSQSRSHDTPETALIDEVPPKVRAVAWAWKTNNNVKEFLALSFIHLARARSRMNTTLSEMLASYVISVIRRHKGEHVRFSKVKITDMFLNRCFLLTDVVNVMSDGFIASAYFFYA